MKAVMPPRTPNWHQWMSIISLMAGMHPIRTLLPPEILGNFPLLQIPTHAKRRGCAERLRMNTTAAGLVQDPYLRLLRFILVALVHQSIMPTPPAGFLLQALLALTARLMHITVSQVLMVPQTIEKPVGIAATGENGVGIRVDDVVGQHIFMGRPHHLGSRVHVCEARHKHPRLRILHAPTGIQGRLSPLKSSRGLLEVPLLISAPYDRLRVTATTIGKILFPWSRRRRARGSLVLHTLPLRVVHADQRVPVLLPSAVLILRRSIKTGGGEGRERRRWRQLHLLARRRLRETASVDPMLGKRMSVVGRRHQSRLSVRKTRTLRSKSTIPNVMSLSGLPAQLAPGHRADPRSHRRQALYRSRLFALSTTITTRGLLMP